MGVPLILMCTVVAYYMYSIYRYVSDVIGKAQEQIIRSANVQQEPAGENNNEKEDGRFNNDHQAIYGSSLLPYDPQQNHPERNRGESSSVVDKGINKSVGVMDETHETTSAGDSDMVQENPHLSPTNNLRKGMKKLVVSERSMSATVGTKGTSTSLKSRTSNPSSRLSGALKDAYEKMENRKSETAKQAYYYIGIFLFTHTWNLGVSGLMIFGIPQPFWLLFLAQICWPVQGFANMFVYVRARVAILRRDYAPASYFHLIYWSIFYFDESKGALRRTEMPKDHRRRAGFLSGLAPPVSDLTNPSGIDASSRLSKGPAVEECRAESEADVSIQRKEGLTSRDLSGKGHIEEDRQPMPT